MPSAVSEGMKHQDSRIQGLITACPVIETYLDLSEGPNFIFSQVGVLLRDRKLNPAAETAVYDYLNRLGGDDRETQNLLVVNVLEILGDTPESSALARDKLAGNALLLFERVLRGWHLGRN
jgi:hypothetical protein